MTNRAGPRRPPGPTTRLLGPASEDGRPLVRLLLDEGRFEYDEQGRLTWTSHVRYEILEAGALESDWSVVTAWWSPWHQVRPEIRATVELPNGDVQELDPSSIEESVPAGYDPTMFTDRRRLRAPLPSLVVGAVIDSTIVWRDHLPFPGGGGSGRFYFGTSAARVERARLVIEAPDSLELKYLLRGLSLEPEETRSGGARRIVFEGGPYAKRAYPEPDLPLAQVAYPQIWFTPVESWSKAARAYAALVEEQIEPSKQLEEALGSRFDGERRENVAAAMLSAIHARVRYTGLEFGTSSIVPGRPSEVIERGFGDCKDKAVLLVSLLRGHGVPAHLALVRAQSRSDVSDEIPALDMFDHAVVYVPGDRPLWIDATRDDVPVGDIPIDLQGRQALVIAPETTGLSRIPELPAGNNLYREIREVTMASFGEGRLRETTEGRGHIERTLRSQYDGQDQKSVEEMLLDYAKRNYGASEVHGVARSGMKGSEGPFRLRFEAVDASRIYTSDNDAALPLSRAALLDWLPRSLKQTEGDEKRVAPLRLARPHHAEIRYEIALPPGFVVREPLESKTEALGPVSLERRYKAGEQEVVVTYRLRAEKRLFSPAEVDAFRKAYASLEMEDLLHLDHRGALLSAQGRSKESLSYYRALADQHPDLPSARARLARALHDAGFGEAARKEARRAVSLDPRSYFAQFILGLTLSNDPLGRPKSDGIDREGAEAAYRRAKALDPENLAPRLNLAILLEQGTDGVRYGEGANLGAAIEEYLAVASELKDDSLEQNLFVDYWRSGRVEELEERARKAAPSLARNAYLVAATLLRGGVGAADRALDNLGVAADLEKVVQEALQLLLVVRRYADAGALAARGGLESATAARLWARMKPYEELIAESDGPTRIAIQFVAAMADASLKDGLSLLAKERRSTASGKQLIERSTKQFLRTIKDKQLSHLPPEFFLDSALTMMKMEVDGRPNVGHRVRVTSAVQGKFSVFVVEEEKAFRLLTDNSDLAPLGARALALLDAGRVEDGTQWLDWARDELGDRKGDRTKALFDRFWPATGATMLENARAAAASLMLANADTALKGAPVLAALSTGSDPRAAQPIHEAVAGSYLLAEKPRKALPYAESAYRGRPEHLAPVVLYVEALRGSGKSRRARQILDSYLEKQPDDATAVMMLGQVLADDLGDYAAAMALFEPRIGAGGAWVNVCNEYAWTSLFTKTHDPRALECIEGAVAATRFSRPGILHTLGAIYAEQDRPESDAGISAAGRAPRLSAGERGLVHLWPSRRGLCAVRRRARRLPQSRSKRKDAPLNLQAGGGWN